MREMKDSGIEWIGEIPKDWITLKMAYAYNTITDFTASGSFASLAENVIYRDDEEYAMLVRAADLSKKRTMGTVYIDKHAYEFLHTSNLYGGELILPNIGSVGDVYLYTPLYPRASLAPNAIMVRPSDNDTKILYYLFLTVPASNALKQLSNATTQAKFNKTQLRKMKIVLPPKLEEKRIIAYLDSRCSEIDSLSTDIQSQIDILNQYKQSVITEAVTKGLDKNAEMKDSGVEWIGKIPKDWDVDKVKYMCTKISKGIGPHYTEQEITPIVNQATFSKGYFDLENIRYGTDLLNNNYARLHHGDVLIATTGGGVLGKTFFFEQEDQYLASTDVAFLSTSNVMINKYMYYCFSINYKTFNDVMARGSTNQTHLQMSLLENMLLPKPQYNTLVRIVSVLDARCSEIDKAILTKQSQLTKLAEYKKSLIYEYVTGKKKVPEVS